MVINTLHNSRGKSFSTLVSGVESNLYNRSGLQILFPVSLLSRRGLTTVSDCCLSVIRSKERTETYNTELTGAGCYKANICAIRAHHSNKEVVTPHKHH